MGVIYKLTDDVVQFILEQKRADGNLSCRELVERIAAQFQREVSKSSVHEVLKQANIASPRGRKSKNKFQIPAQKKAQLLAGLPPMVLLAPPPTEELPETPREEPSAMLLPDPVAAPLPPARETSEKAIPETLKPLERGQEQEGMGVIFLEAAFRDLFPGSWRGAKNYTELGTVPADELNKEWDYRSLMAGDFKVTLQDGSIFYIDSRLQTVSGRPQAQASGAAPVERALAEMADFLLNNIQPIVIKEVTADYLTDFWAAFEGKENKNIARAALLSPQGEELADFGDVIHQNRQFVIGISPQVIDIKGDIQTIASHLYPQALRFMAGNFTRGDLQCRAFVIVGQEDGPPKAFLSNIPSSVGDGALVRLYAQRHLLGVPASCRPAAASPGGSVEDRLKAYAQRFFPRDLSVGEWQTLLAARGQQQYDDRICITVLVPPNGIDPSLLGHAAAAVNALGAMDGNGRRIYCRSD